MQPDDQDVPRLVILQPAELAGQVLLLARSESVIGRAEAADIVVADRLLSRSHALVTVSDESVVVIHDLNSTSGTFVNDQRVTGPVELHAGDMVRLSDLIARFEQTAPAAAAIDPQPAPAIAAESLVDAVAEMPVSSVAMPPVAEPVVDEPVAVRSPVITEPPVSALPVSTAPTAPAPVEPPPAGIYLVTGTVSSPDSASVGGLSVQLVDKNVGVADIVEARTTTSETGTFALHATIDPKQLAEHRKTQPDLQVRVTVADRILASSVVRWNAGPTEVLDVVLPAGLVVLPSEHEALGMAISRHVTGTLGDLVEDAERQDITYLANKTGWDARAIAMSAQAEQLSRGSATTSSTTTPAAAAGIDPALYYALLRAGLPSDPQALHQTAPARIAAIWDQALAQRVIPATLGAATGAALESFLTIAAAGALSATPYVGPSTLGDLLTNTFGADTASKQRFAELYVRYAADPTTLWNQAEQAFGTDTTAELQLDGQLGYLTLNNAPLVAALRSDQASQPLRSAADLATRGYHDAAAWQALLAGIEPPAEVPGDTLGDRTAAYAALLAAQVRLSFPTASVAAMVRAQAIPLGDGDIQPAVADFLAAEQSSFDIGAEPVARYLARTGTAADPGVVAQVTRLQRVYQITPNAAAMSALFAANIDSAYAITGLGEDTFVGRFADAMGGADIAAATFAQARTVNAATTSVALSYLAAKRAMPLGGGGFGSLIEPLSGWNTFHQPPAGTPTPTPVFAQATLDDLFGQLDYCTCDDCRSILSPAAYLVDLLQYIDKTPANPHFHNPQDVLLGRRPDLALLPLTCDNTNVALPYLDLVNETLEYYVGNHLTLADYAGHNTDATVSSAELIASPQNDDDAVAQTAYDSLKQAWFPAPLPFHRDLELLRRHLSGLQLDLGDLMRVLRVDERLANPPFADAVSYGWCDILAERLGLSRLEYRLLTDSSLTIQDVYGFPGSDATVIAELSVLQEFSRRTGVSYTDIVAILQTSFINPQAWLIPLVEDLAVTAATIGQLHAGTITAAQFAAMLPAGLDPGRYIPQSHDPLDVAGWVLTNYSAIMDLIVIDVAGGPADTTNMRLQYLDPAPGSLQSVDLLRLARFIRLWQKLGLTIAQTDSLIGALFATTDPPGDTDLQKLDSGMLTMLPRAGLVYLTMDLLGLDPARGLERILPCWAPIETAGGESLYARMFLNPTVRATATDAPVFAPTADGSILPPGSGNLFDHASTLCAALNLTADEFATITGTSTTPVAGLGLGYTAATPLTLETVSAVYRYAFLARSLRLSVLELLCLSHLSGIDPFAPPVLDAARPVSAPMLEFIRLVQALSSGGLSPVQALYLLWNVDLSGISTPSPAVVTGLASALRGAFATVDSQFAVTADVGLEGAKSLMALVLGATATDLFFGLLTGAFVTSVPFGYGQSRLPAPVIAASTLPDATAQVSYDDLAKQLTAHGYLDADMAGALQSAASADADLATAIAALVDANTAAVDAFFATYDDPDLRLQTLFTAYAESADATVRGNVTVLLDALIPVLAQRRKRQQALTTVSGVAGCDPSFAPALLTDVRAIPASSDPTATGVDDLVTVGRGGLTARYFYTDNPAAAADLVSSPVADLNYGPANPLRPAADAGSDPFAVTWSGYLAAPQTGDVNLRIAVSAGVSLDVAIGGQSISGTFDAAHVWTNSGAHAQIALTAGALTPIRITATGLTGTFALTWQGLGTGYQPIPATALYSEESIADLSATYLRFLKVTALGGNLSLSAADLVYLATSPQLTVGATPWMSTLTVAGPAGAAIAGDLTRLLRAVLHYAALKARFAPGGTRWLDAITATAGGDTTALRALTGWDAASLAGLTTRLFAAAGASNITAVHGLDTASALARLTETFDLIAGSGLPAATLIAAATHDPDEAGVQALQSALRSRLAEADWLAAVAPISDDLREMQRDALVAYILVNAGATILAALGIAVTPNRVATADDLFNYFLMDVEMQPCMETSRIRHALSAVQLFIERCLRNLEPEVDPGDITADEWVWRKRYRVWQANREVFLWPENWLDPSLRDQQSPIFKTTLSALLQSDITDDAAVSAYLGYLSGLEQVAKLEPCGLYYQPAIGDQPPLAHVIARTSGAHRKYYYRRFFGGSWTPWDEVKLPIEDNPVVPYVWNGRLLLLWLQIHQRPGMKPGDVTAALPAGSGSLANFTLDQNAAALAKSGAAMGTAQVGAVLCFSEYYNGAWQPIKTSEITAPLDLGPAPLDRKLLVIRPWTAVDTTDESLYVQITSDNKSAVADWSSYEGSNDVASDPLGFVLHNTHSSPLTWSDVQSEKLQNAREMRFLFPDGTGYETGSVQHAVYSHSPVPHPADNSAYTTINEFYVLHSRYPQTIRPAQQDVTSQWQMPFFLTDVRNAFYVTTTAPVPPLNQYRGYGVATGAAYANAAQAKIPDLVAAAVPRQPGDPVELNRRIGDPAAARQSLAAASMHAVIASPDTFTFRGRDIAATGSAAASIEGTL